MTKNTRTGLWIAVALLAGVAAGAVGMLSLRGGDGPYASSPGATRSMGAASASTAFVDAVAGNCDVTPLLPTAGNGDGHEMLPAQAADATPDAVASRILSGKEAAAAGRQRDAEVAFLDACRNAAALRDGDPIPVADAMYQLGRHYANVAAMGGAKGKEKDLFRRAERLYSASLEAYRARYGDGHEKTRFAREGLVTVQQATGGKPPTALAKAAAAPAAPAPAAAVAAAPASAPAPAAVIPPPLAAASAATPIDVAKVEPPRAAASQPRRRAAPRAQDEAPASRPEAASIEPLAAPVPSRERAAPRREEPETTAATPEEPRPRPPARRAPAQDNASDEGALVEAAPPPPRRPRPAPVVPVEPPSEAPPPNPSISGAGPASTAEGSPGTP